MLTRGISQARAYTITLAELVYDVHVHGNAPGLPRLYWEVGARRASHAGRKLAVTNKREMRCCRVDLMRSARTQVPPISLINGRSTVWVSSTDELIERG